MPVRIPQTIEYEIFQTWLCGVFRHQNALMHGVSDATVSNVVAEHRRRHGSELLDHLRALSLSMSRSSLSYWECAVGHRITLILRNMGAGEDQFEEFIRQLWELHTKVGLAPDRLVNEIEELHWFRKNNQSMNRVGVSIPKICEDIKMKQAEFEGLDTKCNNLRESISDKLHQQAAIEAELKFDNELKEKLKAKGLQIKEILETADLAAFVKESGYSVREVKQRFATFSEMDTACNIINHKVLIEGLKHDQLLRENEILEETKSKSSQRLQELEILEMKGFGLKEFKMIHNVINEIAAQRGISTEDNTAVKILFDDLRDHFYDYLPLAEKSEQLKLEIRKLGENRDMINTALNLSQEIYKSSELLTRKGFKKEDLERIRNSVVENYVPTNLTTTTTTTSTSDIKGNSSNKNLTNSNEAVDMVRANEVESQGGWDSAAMLGNNSEKIRLTQGTERRKPVCYARCGLKPPRSKLVYGGLMHKRDALDRNILKGGASIRINNQSACPRTGNEKQLSESASEDLKKDTPKFEKHEDMTNPHQLYGGSDQGEFYGTNILDYLAYLQKRKCKTSISPNLKVRLKDANSYYSQRKIKNVKGHSGLGSIGKGKMESEDSIVRRNRFSRPACNYIPDEERNPKTPCGPSINPRQPIRSLREGLGTYLSAQQVNKCTHLELEEGWQNFSLSSLVDEAALYPILRQLASSDKVERRG